MARQEWSAQFKQEALPPAPPGWNKTVEDLTQEMLRGLRASVGSPEVEWAIEYERSLLPPGTRFPAQGDIYTANHDVAVKLLVSWRAPVTTCIGYTLPAGAGVRIESEAADRPITVYALPIDYKGVEKAAVPLWTRWRPSYQGYCVALETRELLRSFALAPGNAPPA